MAMTDYKDSLAYLQDPVMQPKISLTIYKNQPMLNLHQLSSVELRQICYFLTIVEQGNSFSRAAECLHIEQPPLSQRIKALEKKHKIAVSQSQGSCESCVIILGQPMTKNSPPQ